VWNKQKSFL